MIIFNVFRHVNVVIAAMWHVDINIRVICSCNYESRGFICFCSSNYYENGFRIVFTYCKVRLASKQRVLCSETTWLACC